MTGPERTDALEVRIDKLERWKDEIEEERRISREQRSNLLWRVAVLERVVWAFLAAALAVSLWVLKSKLVGPHE